MIFGVPSGNYRPAGLAQRARQLAVNPNLSIVVQRSLKYGCGTGRIEITDAIGNRQLDAIPVEAEPAIATPLIQSCRANDFPLGIVEIGGTGVRGIVVCFNRCARRLLVWSRPAEISFDDLRIAVTPVTFYRFHTVRRAKIDDCVWFARRNAG